MKKLEIKPGDKYGGLVIISEIEKIDNIRVFNVKCTNCGKIFSKRMNAFMQIKGNGNGCTCGVGKPKGIPCKYKKEFRKYEKEIRQVYYAIQGRCSGKDRRNSKYYYLKGIKCEWKSFEDFYQDMLPGYEPGLSIDRIDSNGNYCKENCRWADIYTQNANRKGTYKEYNGMTLGMFLREKGYNENEISYAESLRSRKKCNLEFIIEMIPKRKIYKKKLDLI